MSTDQADIKQVERFHEQLIDLIKKYQFRDRNQMTCHGVSVSQCYILETLAHAGALNMNQLADRMYLKISTITRVVEQLAIKGYVRREEYARDRRFVMIHITESGEAVFQKCWKNTFESEIMILSRFPKNQRENLIRLLKELNTAMTEWRKCCK